MFAFVIDLDEVVDFGGCGLPSDGAAFDEPALIVLADGVALGDLALCDPSLIVLAGGGVALGDRSS